MRAASRFRSLRGVLERFAIGAATLKQGYAGSRKQLVSPG